MGGQYKADHSAARQEELQAKWEQNMPCKDCKLSGICRYYNSIKRLDYDPEIFTVTIACTQKQPNIREVY